QGRQRTGVQFRDAIINGGNLSLHQTGQVVFNLSAREAVGRPEQHGLTNVEITDIPRPGTEGKPLTLKVGAAGKTNKKQQQRCNTGAYQHSPLRGYLDKIRAHYRDR